MKQNYKIAQYCVIENKKVFLNGVEEFSSDDEQFPDFIKAAYKKFNSNYPKFFKMDNLSKLSFLAADLLLKELRLNEEDNDIAVVFANKSASLDTDVKYQRSIANKEEYFPSPAVFVYTLPNICIGEISIKHHLKSENTFFVFDTFNVEFIYNYANHLLESNKTEKVLCGWVEFFEDNYKAVVYLVQNNGILDHNIKTINTIYNK
ncbi:MAG: 3-oxoacyl-ACP synthase [Flavobacterium sp.]